MADKRGIARISVRALTGLIGVGVAVVAVAGATLLPIPSFSITAPVATVTPVPADQQRVCPGPLLALAAGAGSATRPSAFGAPSTSYGSDSSDVQTRLLKTATDTSDPGEAPLDITVPTPPGSTAPPLLAGAQWQDASTDDLAGLAAASCDEPSADSWLVAGSTALGQTSLVLLSNPTSVEATVNLTIFAETGAVDAPGAAGIVIPPGSQTVVPLAGLAPSVTAPVVHVKTSGGQVLASLQQSYEQGIEPRGAELSGATGAPSQTQVISGVTIRNLAKVTAAQTGEGYGVDLPAVRVFVPGDQPAEVAVGAVGESGTAAGNSVSVTVKPGVVAEIPLQNLKDGNYTVTVHSSEPVVAAARTSVMGAKTRDFSWFVSSQPMSDRFLVVVPSAPAPIIHLANAGTTDRAVTLTAESGKKLKFTVPGEGAVNRPIPAGTYTADGADDLVTSISFSKDGSASSFALNPPGPLAAPLDVYAR
ncbi:DUF5719 family protein [Leifsonia poae]|uniref:Large extracellular alpha-helical protein n=1 Tax=Leifsonia poae TaxID=110933 RepID=A0A9W6LZG1_9MICO|nr:DUF5719 family protein [Leifsonia poae]GLJ75584.1 hypothetical protein GCM10017584_11580 [Leifsonia poae]